jgi:hypothetical protein
VQEVREEQPGGPGPDDPDLRACAHGEHPVYMLVPRTPCVPRADVESLTS